MTASYRHMTLILLAPVVSTAIAVACKSQPEPAAPEPAERTGLVAQPCPELELPDSAVDAQNVRVFVEVADVATRELPQPIGRWLDENAVKIRAAANLVAFPGVPTSVPWGQCVDAVCTSNARSLTLTARPPERSIDPIELSVRVEQAPEGSNQAATTLLESSVRAVHQEPVVLPGAAAVSEGSVVLTAYLLQRHDDLQRVLACRARQTEQEKQLAD